MNPFISPVHIRHFFRDGLTTLLHRPDVTLGQLVLIAANAMTLEDKHVLKKAAEASAPHVVDIEETNEDQQVMLAIQQSPDPLNLIQHRVTPAGRRLQLNYLRAHRPRRSASAPATTIHQPYNANGFNFTRVPHEIFWEGEWKGTRVGCYYNKYPFAPYHAVIVPDPAGQHEQYLRHQDHILAWEMATALASDEPSVVIGYNSLGAYASVNHLHFQMILDGSHLPLLSTRRPGRYIIPVAEYREPNDAWRHLSQLQDHNQPFNALYLPGRLLVIPRRFQGSYPQPDWTTGFAWYELAGGLIVIDPQAFETLIDADIDQALKALV